jgi:putative transposase
MRRERHSVSDLKVHLICVTKYRRSVLTHESLIVVEQAFRSVAKSMDFQIDSFNGEADHVHALILYPPKLSVSQIANAVKGVSSRAYGKAGFIKPHKESLWSASHYCSSIGGAPLDVLKHYIQNQSRPQGQGL